MFLLLASVAHAVPEFPPRIEEYLGMPCEPQCTICHASNVGGLGTVTQPFGIAMVEHGLNLSDPASLEAALDGVEADGIDSDGDGVGDIDELRDGTNPNAAGEAVCETRAAAPEYGCLSVTGGASATAGVLLAVGAMVGARRR